MPHCVPQNKHPLWAFVGRLVEKVRVSPMLMPVNTHTVTRAGPLSAESYSLADCGLHRHWLCWNWPRKLLSIPRVFPFGLPSHWSSGFVEGQTWLGPSLWVKDSRWALGPHGKICALMTEPCFTATPILQCLLFHPQLGPSQPLSTLSQLLIPPLPLPAGEGLHLTST